VLKPPPATENAGQRFCTAPAQKKNNYGAPAVPVPQYFPESLYFLLYSTKKGKFLFIW
jgi:hypothetical protein